MVAFAPCVKLAEGLEPTTTGLQNRCSTIELRERSERRSGIFYYRTPHEFGQYWALARPLCPDSLVVALSYARLQYLDSPEVARVREIDAGLLPAIAHLGRFGIESNCLRVCGDSA